MKTTDVIILGILLYLLWPKEKVQAGDVTFRASDEHGPVILIPEFPINYDAYWKRQF